MSPVHTLSFSTRRHFLAATAAMLGLNVVRIQSGGPRDLQPLDSNTLANYRLTADVFKRFGHATRLIGAVLRRDARFDREPLITRDISVGGDAAEMATALQTRLDAEPALHAALFAADMSSREYATFAIALIGARLAYGFITSGAMRRVPPGVAADNVAFVAAHETEVVSLLKQLNLD